MKKLSFEDALILSAAKAARFLVKTLPFRVSLRIGAFFGRLSYRTSKRRRIAYSNLRWVFHGEKSPAELRATSLRAAGNLAMTMVDLLRLPDMDKRYVDRHVKVAGREKLEPLIGKAVIFLTGHFGSWELLNAVGNLEGWPTVALAREQKHPRSNEFLNRLRTSTGAQVIKKGMNIREILRALHAGKIVGIVADQDGGKRGTFVDFFGRLSSTPPGAAAFAARTGAVVVPVFIFREKLDDHRIEIDDPLPAPDPTIDPDEAEKRLMQAFARSLEAKIRKAPDQWLWAHRRWKSSPDRHVLVLSDGKAGHLSQSLAFVGSMRETRAEQGAEHRFFHRTVQIRFRDESCRRVFRAACVFSGGAPPFGERLLRWALEPACYREIESSYADVVVSTGSSLAGVNLVLRSLLAARSAVLMDPGLPSRRFDAVIAPRHDRMKESGGVYVTERSPSSVRVETLAVEAARLAKEFPAVNGTPKVGLLLGGDTKDTRFTPAALEEALMSLVTYLGDTQSHLLATTSRRTPAWAETLVKERLGASGRCPVLVIANEANRAGVVEAILGLADAVIVTGDSMSMVSEAVASRKPVLVFTPGEHRPPARKFTEFLSRLESAKLVFRSAPGGLAEALRAVRGHHPDDLFHRSDEETLRRAARRLLS